MRLPACLSLYLHACLPVCLSASLATAVSSGRTARSTAGPYASCVSNHRVPVRPAVCLTTYLPACPSDRSSPCQPANISVCLYVWSAVSLSVCLSGQLSVCLAGCHLDCLFAWPAVSLWVCSSGRMPAGLLVWPVDCLTDQLYNSPLARPVLSVSVCLHGRWSISLTVCRPAKRKKHLPT